MTSRFWKNFGLIAGTNILTPFFAVVLVLAISRLSGPELLGKYSLLMAVFIVGQSCASLGFSVILTREAARDRDLGGAYCVSAALVGLTVVAATLAIVCPVLWLAIADRELAVALIVILMALLPSVVTGHAEALLLGFEESRPFVVAGLLERVVGTAVSAALVLLGQGILAIALVILVLRVAVAVWLVALLRARWVLRFRFDRQRCRELVRQIPVLAAIPLVNAFYLRLDVLLIGSLSGFAALGMYSAAARLVDLTKVLPMAYARAIYPVISRLHGEGRGHLEQTFRDACRGLALLMCCVAIAVSGAGDWLIALLYGPSFQEAGSLLRILTWSVVPFALASLFAQVLFAANLAVLDLRVNVIAVCFNAALNMLLIPRWGAHGAAATALASSVVYAALEYHYVRDRVTKPALAATLARISAAAGLGLGAATGALWLAWPSVVAVVAALLAYTAALVFSGSIGRRDVLATYAFLGNFKRV